MSEMETDKLLTIITNMIEKHGCRVVDIDLEKHIIDIEGPDDAQAECALALSKILDPS